MNPPVNNNEGAITITVLVVSAFIIGFIYAHIS